VATADKHTLAADRVTTIDVNEINPTTVIYEYVQVLSTRICQISNHFCFEAQMFLPCLGSDQFVAGFVGLLGPVFYAANSKVEIFPLSTPRQQVSP
jgi:hypothetical protein